MDRTAQMTRQAKYLGHRVSSERVERNRDLMFRCCRFYSSLEFDWYLQLSGSL